MGKRSHYLNNVYSTRNIYIMYYNKNTVHPYSCHFSVGTREKLTRVDCVLSSFPIIINNDNMAAYYYNNN